MKILLTNAVLLLLISGSAHGFATPNIPGKSGNSAPKDDGNDNDKDDDKHASGLRKLGNTPQPSAFKAKIPFLNGMEAPSASEPLIPHTYDPRVHGPMGHPMRPGFAPGGPMGGPMGGPPMGHPMHPGFAPGGPMGGPPMGHPMHGPPPGNHHAPPGSTVDQWGMPDMLRKAPGSSDLDSDHYSAPMQGEGDGHWQKKYGDNIHARNNPFAIPQEFIDYEMDPYDGSPPKYEPIFPEGQNPYEEIGGPDWAPNSKKRQEQQPSMRREQPQQRNMRMPPMEEYPNSQQPNTPIPPVDDYRNAQHPSMFMPMEEYFQGQGPMQGEPFGHEEMPPQGMYGEPFRPQEQAPQQERSQNSRANMWPYNVSPPVRFEGNGFVPMEDPNTMNQGPMPGNDYVPMGDLNMRNQGPMPGNDYVPMGDPSMMMGQQRMPGNEYVTTGDPNMMMGRPQGPPMGNDFLPMEDPNMMMGRPQGPPMGNDFLAMEDPNMMRPPHHYDHPSNDFHQPPMNDFMPPMEEYGMFGEPYHPHEEPMFMPGAVYGPEPGFHLDPQQYTSQDEWYIRGQNDHTRRQSGLDRGNNSY